MAARFTGVDVAISLDKHLPTAAGIGGGSSDAAAVLSGIEQLTGDVSAGDVSDLGADVPMCLAGTAARVQGIGDQVAPLALPKLHAVLVNPREAVSTVSVFKALETKTHAPMTEPPKHASVQEFCVWLRDQRNDLEAPAISICPAIGDVLRDLSQTPKPLCYRMSGSGATCFALYEDMGLAEIAAQQLERTHPEWWVRDCVLS